MKKLFLPTVLLALSIGSASAATTTWASDLSGNINNLEIDGMLYNTTYDASPGLPEFRVTGDFGYKAVAAMAAFFNGAGRSIYLANFKDTKFNVFATDMAHWVYFDDRFAPFSVAETGACVLGTTMCYPSSIARALKAAPPVLTLSAVTPVSRVPVPTATLMFVPTLLGFIGLRLKKVSLS